MSKSLNLVVLIILLLITCFSTVSSFEFSQNSLKKHVYFLASDSLEGRYSGTKKMELATNYIVEEFKQAGLKPFGNSFIQEFPLPPLYGRNIIGYIEGSDSILKNEYIVLGAHYDHVGWYIKDDSVKTVFNGADDNASGTAAIIEISKALVQKRELLKRSVIIIAFDAEERGLLGSKYFLKHPIIESIKIKAMFSIDMVGWLDKESPLVFSGCGSFEGGVEFMEGIEQVVDLNVEYLDSKIMWKDRTDTKPFYDSEIPCIYVSTGLNSPYHKPEDDADSINYEGMIKVCKQIYNATRELSAKQDYQFLKTKELIRTINEPLKIGVNLSFVTNYHNYSEGPYIAKHLYGAAGGLFAQIELSKKFSLQPELSYCYYGSQSPQGNVRLHSIDIPINILLHSDSDMQRVFLYIGGFVNYSFGGTLSGKKIDWEVQKFNRIDYGYQIGWGLEIFNFQISFKSKFGFNNFYKNKQPINGKATNTSLFITLGYYFLP